MNREDRKDTLIKLFNNLLTNTAEALPELQTLFTENLCEYSKEEQLIVYNIIGVIESKIINIPTLFTQIQILKLKLLDIALHESENSHEESCKNSCEECKGCAPTVEEDPNIYFRNDAGVILKHYDNLSLKLPENAEKGIIIIRQVNDEGLPYRARVEINKNYDVINILEEPELENTEPLDFDSLYTDLASEVLKFKKDE